MNKSFDIKKIAVIGLDGLSWQYFEKILKSGAMPNVKGLYQKSYRSVLEATIPPSTPPSWSSIMTGVNPGKHGVFAFDYIDMKTLKQKLFTALDLMHPRIHEMLAMREISSVVINPIPDYPLIPMKHTNLISNLFFTPKTVYHPSSMEKYTKILSQAEEFRMDNSLDYIEKSFKIAEIYEELIRDTAENLDWKLYWVNFNIPDFYLHKEPELLSNKVIRDEIKLFSIIDRIIKLLSDYSDALVIVSDHGFSLYKWRISINDLLLKKGFAKIGRPEETVREHHELLSEHEFKYASKKLLPLLGLLYHQSLKPLRKLLKKLYKLFKGEAPKFIIGIDMNNSKAFMGTRYSHGVYVKNPEDIPAIIDLLKNTEGIKWAKRREEVYWGPYVDRAAPVIVRPDYDKGYFLALNRVYGRVHLRVDAGDHHPDGVFMLYAPSLQIDNAWPRKLPVYFVTPLIMYLLGVPLSSATDSIHLLRKIYQDSNIKLTDNYLERWGIVKKATILRRRIRSMRQAR